MTLHDVSASVRELPTRDVEPFLTRAQVAGNLGIGLSTLDMLVREGLPSEQWGLRTRRFQLSRVKAWLRERERRAAA